jgi:GTP cyclohydrolase II
LDKFAALDRYGIRVAERVPHIFPSNGPDELCLRTKLKANRKRLL